MYPSHRAPVQEVDITHLKKDVSRLLRADNHHMSVVNRAQVISERAEKYVNQVHLSEMFVSRGQLNAAPGESVLTALRSGRVLVPRQRGAGSTTIDSDKSNKCWTTA